MKTSVEAIRDHAELLEFQAKENANTVTAQQREIADLRSQIARLQRENVKLSRRVGELTVTAKRDAEIMLAVALHRKDVQRAFDDPDSVLINTDERDYSTPQRPAINSLFNILADRHKHALLAFFAHVLTGGSIDFEERS